MWTQNLVRLGQQVVLQHSKNYNNAGLYRSCDFCICMNMILPNTIDKRKFDEAKLKVLTGNYQQPGFGTLKEKTLHATMKQYYSFDESTHEQPVCGYIADIFDGETIIEIQNGNFGHMRDKLAAFLPEYEVYLIYPFPHYKWLCWIDTETGEVVSRRRSPKVGNAFHAMPEFFRIKKYLTDPHLHIRISLIDIEEYRLLNGKRSKDKKRGSTRYDRVPLDIYDEIVFDSIFDYLKILPPELSEEFTAKDLARMAKIHVQYAQEALKLMYDLGLVARIGKKGNAYVYRVFEERRE